MNVAADIRDTVAHLRAQVADLHAELPRNRLVVWTAGNVSARVPGHDLLVIKPSGVTYDQLTAESMVVTDFDGRLVEGDHSPSSDTAAHAYVYRHMPDVGGVVHTHSTYACAWAALRRPVPCVLTMMADEFGGEIPIGPFALIGDDSIGRGIVNTLRESRSSAVLMANHGPFTIGRDAIAAVKAAVMCEDVCRSAYLAAPAGRSGVDTANRHRLAPYPLSERVRAERHHRTHIDSADTDRDEGHLMTTTPAAEEQQVWFLTGSQGLYGRETLDEVADQSRVIATQLDNAPELPVPVVWKPVLTDADAIRRMMLDANSDDACVGLIIWMHTFSPAKMWIGGLSALRKPLLHLHTQANVDLPWAEIDMDFMNLNQAAHGDREVGYVQTPHGYHPQKPLPGMSPTRGSGPGSGSGNAPLSVSTPSAISGWPGSGTTCVTSL